MGELSHLKGLKTLSCIVLSDNPVAARYSDREHYGKEVVKKLPGVKHLDGVAITPPKQLPPVQANYLPEGTGPTLVSFAQKYLIMASLSVCRHGV